MSILDENGNPPAPAHGDAVAQTKQLVLAEIEKLREMVRQLDQVSESGEDLSFVSNTVKAMQAADRLQRFLSLDMDRSKQPIDSSNIGVTQEQADLADTSVP